jgi:hypothetical protein
VEELTIRQTQLKTQWSSGCKAWDILGRGGWRKLWLRVSPSTLSLYKLGSVVSLFDQPLLHHKLLKDMGKGLYGTLGASFGYHGPCSLLGIKKCGFVHPWKNSDWARTFSALSIGDVTGSDRQGYVIAF